MSLCVSETTAAKIAVVPPTMAISVIATGDSITNALNRTSRKGPAFTMVAA